MTLKTMYPPQKDSPSTFLLGNISTSDVSMTVGNAAVLPQIVPYPLTIGFDKPITETVMVTAINLGTNTLTVTRGTPAYAWVAGSVVARVFTANDLKDVQDNILDIDSGLTTTKGTVATQGTDISTLKTTVGTASSGLVKGLADEIARAKAAEAAEVSRATGVENTLSSSKVNRSELVQVITDWSYSADGTKVLVTITRYNASTQQTTSYTRTLPIVSDDTMGVMTPEAYNEITALRNDVMALQQQGGRFIGMSFNSKSALNSYVIPGSVKMGDFTYVIDDETHSNATTRYVFNGTSFNFAFIVNYDPVGLANTTTPGLVKSSNTTGKAFVETDGTISVVGWDVLNSDVTSRVPQIRTVNSKPLSSNVTLNQDDIGDGTTNKAYTATEKTKLAGIATGATKNTVAQYAATISTTWIGSSAPYTQTVTVSGLLSTDIPIFGIVPSTTTATALLQKEAWNMIGKIETIANGITITCYEEKPTTAIPIQIRVVK